MNFAGQLAALGYPTYADYLQSQHWQDFRLAYRQAGLPMRCAVCHKKPIQLHHVTYKRLGAEKLTDVLPLCGDHHKAVHRWLAERRQPVEQSRQAIAALVAAPVSAPAKKKRKKKKPTKPKRKKRAPGTCDRALRERVFQRPVDARSNGALEKNWGNPEIAMRMIAAGLRPPR